VALQGKTTKTAAAAAFVCGTAQGAGQVKRGESESADVPYSKTDGAVASSLSLRRRRRRRPLIKVRLLLAHPEKLGQVWQKVGRSNG